MSGTRELALIQIGAMLTASVLSPTTSAGDIPPAYIATARLYHIPPPVLYAVGMVESRRPSFAGNLPWPWTLNVEGTAEFYPSRREAWFALQKHIKQKRLVDIGLMQVNWHWHKERLGTPWKALDPHFNLTTGARILREQYDASGDWMIAAGRYHAPRNATRAQQYRERVERVLKDIRYEG